MHKRITIQTAKRLTGVGEYYFSQKLRDIDNMNKAGRDVINLGIGSPDMPPHPDVIKTLEKESARPDVHAYQSYKGSPVLRNAAAAWYQTWYKVNLDADTEILPLIGSKEGIMHICMTYLDEGDEVLIPDPGYPAYSSAVRIAGGKVVTYDLTAANNWLIDLDALAASDLSKVKLMFVNYPHMPTGQLPSATFFKKLVDLAAQHNILLVHDNPYSFILNAEPMSLLSIDGAKNNVIELNSLSKSHNMAGWRIGLLCGAKERIAEVLHFKSNMDSGMFLPIQLAAAKALVLEKDWYEKLNKVYKARKEKVLELLDLLNCSFDKKQVGMFVWAAIPDGIRDGYAFSDKVLHGANVFITPGGIFGNNGNGYVRISLCANEDKINEAINRIKAIQ